MTDSLQRIGGRCAFLTVLLVAILGAQDYRARVQGHVVDLSGAVVVGAEVTLRNVETGVETRRNSDINGHYLFDLVLPGNYEVIVELEGFNRFVQQNIRVQTRADITVDAHMEVGAVTQSVTVSESPVAVSFNTTSMETTVDNKMVREIPLLDRNPYLLALLDPAVMPRATTTEPYTYWTMTTMEIGGENTNRQNEVLLDGNPAQLGRKGSYAPPMDAVNEVTVMQNPVDAEYGATSGGILNISMRSGTNDIHGAAYWFGRNPVFNAAANPWTHSENKTKSNSWGANAGFPVLKNKVFNFLAYEQWKRGKPGNRTYTVPTQMERAGDFSETLNGKGSLRQVFDPFSTRFDPDLNVAIRDPFPGNIIPGDRFDPTAVAMMEDVIRPNNPGTGPDHINNFRAIAMRTANYFNITNRTDWAVNEKLRVFGRVSMIRTDNTEADWTGINSKMAGLYGTDSDSTSIAGDVIYTINPSTVLNLRGGYTTMHDNYKPEEMMLTQDDLDRFWPGNTYYMPYYEIRGLDQPLYYPEIKLDGKRYSRNNFWIGHSYQYSFNGKLSKQVGRHFLKMGGDWRRYNKQGTWQAAGMSRFRFNTHMTANTFIKPDTRLYGYNWATFLLGAIDNNQSQIQVKPLAEPVSHLVSAYIQDDFKVNRRITLNLGVRWEYELGVTNHLGRFSRAFDLHDPIPEMQANPPDIPQEALDIMNQPYQFAGAWHFTEGPGDPMYDTYKWNFSPRAGIAIRINDKTSLRAGYARFVTPFIKQNAQLTGQNPMPGFDATTRVLPALEGVPQEVLSNPFSPEKNPLILPYGKKYGRYTNLGGTAEWTIGLPKPNVNNRFNVSFQRQLPHEFVLDVTYFVNLGSDMQYTHNYNQMDPKLSYEYKSQLNKSVDNPFYNYMTPETFPGQLRNRSKVKLSELLKPYPQYGAVRQRWTNGPRHRYQSLQIKLQRQFANGFNFLLGYNYNRQKTEAFYSADEQYLNQWGWQRSVRPRAKLNIAGIWELPFGQGRRFLTDANALVDGVLGGWQVSGVYTYISGDNLRFSALTEVGSPVIASPNKWGRWFDGDAFDKQPAYTPRSNPWSYPDLWGPHAHTLNAALSKSFRITERFRLEFRMEANNFTNTMNAGNPNTSYGNSRFGQISGPRSGHLGREFQYNLKLYF